MADWIGMMRSNHIWPTDRNAYIKMLMDYGVSLDEDRFGRIAWASCNGDPAGPLYTERGEYGDFHTSYLLDDVYRYIPFNQVLVVHHSAFCPMEWVTSAHVLLMTQTETFHHQGLSQELLRNIALEFPFWELPDMGRSRQGKAPAFTSP